MYCEIPIFGRCCFCLPLRKGILIFGYLNILFAAFMVGVYSYCIHEDYGATTLFHGVVGELDNWFCLMIYCADVIFSGILLYGVHRQLIFHLKIYYYYAICTLVAVVILEIIVGTKRPFYLELEVLPLFIAGLSLHIYLIFLVRSLLKKLDMSGHTYENQLHQIINGEIAKDPNTVYPSTVIPVENA